MPTRNPSTTAMKSENCFDVGATFEPRAGVMTLPDSTVAMYSTWASRSGSCSDSRASVFESYWSIASSGVVSELRSAGLSAALLQRIESGLRLGSSSGECFDASAEAIAGGDDRGLLGIRIGVGFLDDCRGESVGGSSRLCGSERALHDHLGEWDSRALDADSGGDQLDGDMARQGISGKPSGLARRLLICGLARERIGIERVRRQRVRHERTVR